MFLLKICFLLLMLLAMGCATYQNKVEKAHHFLNSNQFESAQSHLLPLALEESGDQLVYLLDYATTLQISGQFEESNKFFFKAEKLAEEQDYHSVSRVTGSLLLNEEMKQYKGDTFERIFINAYMAMNYLEMGDLDNALVETRRINDKYKLLRSEERKSFELNSFAKYLSAMIWEADRKYDDAFIAYKEAYEIDPQIETIKEDLVRISKKAQRMDEYKRFKSEFLLNADNQEGHDKGNAELIVIYQQGWGPRKRFNSYDVKFPILSPVFSDTQKAKVIISSLSSPKIEKISKNIYNVQEAAIKTLKDDQAALLARRVGAYVAKEVASREISRKNEALGLIAWFVMHASERADLRQWSTLPNSIQVIRILLQPGEYDLEIQGLSAFGNQTQDKMNVKKIKLEKGKTKFLNWRSLN